MAAGDVELLRRAWEAFARGDVEAAADALDPEVCWYGADAEAREDGCHNRDEALAFIRQALAVEMVVYPSVDEALNAAGQPGRA